MTTGFGTHCHQDELGELCQVCIRSFPNRSLTSLYASHEQAHTHPPHANGLQCQIAQPL
jgi:hypothetical protein